MVRHKPSGDYLTTGLRRIGNGGGKVWANKSALKNAFNCHTKDVNDPKAPDFILHPQDYEVLVFREVDHYDLNHFFNWS